MVQDDTLYKFTCLLLTYLLSNFVCRGFDCTLYVGLTIATLVTTREVFGLIPTGIFFRTPTDYSNPIIPEQDPALTGGQHVVSTMLERGNVSGRRI